MTSYYYSQGYNLGQLRRGQQALSRETASDLQQTEYRRVHTSKYTRIFRTYSSTKWNNQSCDIINQTDKFDRNILNEEGGGEGKKGEDLTIQTGPPPHR